MELRKVLEIHKYDGDMWYIHPYIEYGKIVRNDIYKVKKKKKYDFPSHCCFFFEREYGKGVYYATKWNDKAKVNKNTEINVDNIRVFTTREEAKKALEDFEKQHAYRISDSVKREIERLEREKEEIDAQIAKLRETAEKAFKNLSTTFAK